jgi:hypothetical protein
MSSSQSSFSSLFASNRTQNHPLQCQIDGAIYEFRLVTPAERTEQVALSSTSNTSSINLPHQTAFPLPEAIQNAPQPNLRRGQATQTTQASQLIPEGVTIYGGIGEAERQAVNQRIQVQQQRPDQAKDIPPRVLV